MVRLIYVSGKDTDIAQYARMSRGVTEPYPEEDNVKLLEKLFKGGHHEPFEFLDMIFYVECSIVCARQLARHRIGISKVERSLRYVTVGDYDFSEKFEYIIPYAIEKCLFPDIKEDFKHIMNIIFHCYTRLIDRGVAPEDARYVLPLATKTKLYVKFNARSLWHFLQLRTNSHAQTEIRELAWQMLDCLAENENTKNLHKIFKEVLG